MTNKNFEPLRAVFKDADGRPAILWIVRTTRDFIQITDSIGLEQIAALGATRRTLFVDPSLAHACPPDAILDGWIPDWTTLPKMALERERDALRNDVPD